MTRYIYSTRGQAVGYIVGRFIHTIPALIPIKGFKLLHVSYPPLPSFLAQSGLDSFFALADA